MIGIIKDIRGLGILRKCETCKFNFKFRSNKFNFNKCLLGKCKYDK